MKFYKDNMSGPLLINVKMAIFIHFKVDRMRRLAERMRREGWPHFQ